LAHAEADAAVNRAAIQHLHEQLEKLKASAAAAPDDAATPKKAAKKKKK
jgi:hypothetical protein